MRSRGHSETKTITINIEATEEEWRDLLIFLKEHKGYGVEEELEEIVLKYVDYYEDEEVTLNDKK